MRAERLAWVDSADAAHAKLAGDELAPASISRRRRLFHRTIVRIAARVADLVAMMTVTIGLCIAAGIDIWTTPLAAALPFILTPFAGAAGISVAGGYRFHYAESFTGHLCRVAFGASAIMGTVFLAALLAGSSNLALFARLAAFNALAVFALHANYLGVVREAVRRGLLSDNVVIVGATQTAARIASRNVRERELNILGYFDDRAERPSVTLMGDTPYLGGIDELLAWDRLPEVDRIVVTVTSTAQQRVRSLIDRMRNLPHEIILVLDLDGFDPEETSLAHVVQAPAAYISGAPRDMRRAIVKRGFDIVAALAAAILLAPALALIALLIKLEGRSQVLVREEHHGFNGKIINTWKFGVRQPDDIGNTDPKRLTRIGRLICPSRIDELPQLLNVVRGEMSLVGPRSYAIGMTIEETEVHRVVSDYAHRRRMKPGMTGWAQVNGLLGPSILREDVRRRVAHDLEYMSRASIWLDAWILLKTVPQFFSIRRRWR
jgi:polysaccharide biosynthesis protein PslA